MLQLIDFYEFNVLLKDFEDVKFASDEFETLWKESIEILPFDIQKLKKLHILKNFFAILNRSKHF